MYRVSRLTGGIVRQVIHTSDTKVCPPPSAENGYLESMTDADEQIIPLIEARIESAKTNAVVVDINEL